ncbi:MAG: hypothetical protein JST58_20520 [Bacteroidetes bacterium]|nr:hypothetical protein [Bacteroidota bacterium]
MKTALLLFGFLFASQYLLAQENSKLFNEERINMTKNGMMALGAWGTVNLISGSIGIASSGGETKYFHQMNLIWGAVNLSIALPTYLEIKKQASNLSIAETFKQQSHIEKLFLFNAGLDLVYITGGFYCLAKGENDSRQNLYRGYGKSLMMQGGGLLLFDAVMYFSHTHHGKKLFNLLSKVQFTGNSIGLSWKWQ